MICEVIVEIGKICLVITITWVFTITAITITILLCVCGVVLRTENLLWTDLWFCKSLCNNDVYLGVNNLVKHKKKIVKKEHKRKKGFDFRWGMNQTAVKNFNVVFGIISLLTVVCVWCRATVFKLLDWKWFVILQRFV